MAKDNAHIHMLSRTHGQIFELDKGRNGLILRFWRNLSVQLEITTLEGIGKLQ
ncbi:hypothetical protein RYX36_021996, partial [Vicia faba]